MTTADPAPHPPTCDALVGCYGDGWCCRRPLGHTGEHAPVADPPTRARIWGPPSWYSEVLRELARDVEDRMAQAARIHNKYDRARDMQTRENLKYCADFIDHLAATTLVPPASGEPR